MPPRSEIRRSSGARSRRSFDRATPAATRSAVRRRRRAACVASSASLTLRRGPSSRAVKARQPTRNRLAGGQGHSFAGSRSTRAVHADQALVTHGHHGRYLFVERHIGLGMAAKVHHRHLIELKRRQVGQYALAQLFGTLGDNRPNSWRRPCLRGGAIPVLEGLGVIGGEISSPKQVMRWLAPTPRSERLRRVRRATRILSQTAGGGEPP